MPEVVDLSARPDWFVWRNPWPSWLDRYGHVPGLQVVGNGQRVTDLWFHRSHVCLMPDPVSAPVRISTMLAGQAAVMRVEARGIKLRPHQAEAIPFLRERKGSLLAYAPRLGKTLAAAGAHDPADGLLVVVGPLSARDVWCEWIERVHGFKPAVLTGVQDVSTRGPALGTQQAYFVHFDILPAWTEFFAQQLLPPARAQSDPSRRLATLVFDEIHLLASRKTKRVSASNMLAAHADRIIGTSGTPMWSRPDDLYSVLHLISPGAWGNHHAYGRHYCDGQPGAHGWAYNGVSNADELAQRLQSTILLKTWADAVPGLPPTT